MLQLLEKWNSRSSWPHPEYDRDLSRIGIDLQNWRLTEFDEHPGRHPGIGSTHVCMSWTDGEIGLFAQSIPTAFLHIKARIKTDLLAIAIPLEAAPERRLEVEGQSTTERPYMLELLPLPEAGKLDIIAGKGGMESVTLLLKADALARICGIPIVELPEALRSARASASGLLSSHSMPCAVERIAREILAAARVGNFSPLFCKGKSAELLYTLLEYWRSEEERPLETPICERERAGVERIRKLIERDPFASRPMEELSLLSGMNRTKLRYLFKRVCGTTISAFRAGILMHHADDMLRGTTLSIAEIAFRLGYSEASSFNIAYRRFFGHTPGRVRSDPTPVAIGRRIPAAHPTIQPIFRSSAAAASA